MSKHDELLRWRSSKTGLRTGRDLAYSLTVEILPYPEIPERFRDAVTRFRKLRTVERERVADSFLGRRGVKAGA